MVNFLFGRNLSNPKFVLNTIVYFRQNKKPFWFEDQFVKDFLKDVDGTTVLFEEALKDRWGNGISTEMLSTGCKTLCSIYHCKDPAMWFYGTAMGDNCYKWVVQMAKSRTINLFLEHYPYLDSEDFKNNVYYHNGAPVTEYEFDDLYGQWCELSSEGKTDDDTVL